MGQAMTTIHDAAKKRLNVRKKTRVLDLLDGSGALSSGLAPQHAPFLYPKKFTAGELDKERQLHGQDHAPLGVGQFRKVPVRYG
jgi:hypothetical protein